TSTWSGRSLVTSSITRASTAGRRRIRASGCEDAWMPATSLSKSKIVGLACLEENAARSSAPSAAAATPTPSPAASDSASPCPRAGLTCSAASSPSNMAVSIPAPASASFCRRPQSRPDPSSHGVFAVVGGTVYAPLGKWRLGFRATHGPLILAGAPGFWRALRTTFGRGMHPLYILRTQRLGFRPWTTDDLSLALGLWGDPKVTE